MDVRRASGFILIGLGFVGAALLVGSAAWALMEIAGDASWLEAVAWSVAAASGLLFPLVFALVGRRLAFPKEETITPRASPVPPVPDPGDEAATALQGPVTACPDCGFLGVRMPQLRDGVWPGGGELGDRCVCPRCGYQGIVPSFATGHDYASFVRRLNLTWAASARRR